MGSTSTVRSQSCSSLALNALPRSQRRCLSFPYRMKHALKTSSILGSQPKRCRHRPARTYVLIHDGKQPVAASPEQPILDQINTADRIRIQGMHTDNGMSMILQPLASPVASWDLQPFFAPQVFDVLVMDTPALDLQERGDLAVTISAILLGQANEGEPEGVLILNLSSRTIALGTAGLTEPGRYGAHGCEGAGVHGLPYPVPVLGLAPVS